MLVKWVFPKIVIPPNHPIFIGFSHYKPSILGYPYFWKHPNIIVSPESLIRIDFKFENEQFESLSEPRSLLEIYWGRVRECLSCRTRGRGRRDARNFRRLTCSLRLKVWGTWEVDTPTKTFKNSHFPEKRWLEAYLPFWNGPFSGDMFVLRGRSNYASSRCQYFCHIYWQLTP